MKKNIALAILASISTFAMDSNDRDSLSGDSSVSGGSHSSVDSSSARSPNQLFSLQNRSFVGLGVDTTECETYFVITGTDFELIHYTFSAPSFYLNQEVVMPGYFFSDLGGSLGVSTGYSNPTVDKDKHLYLLSTKWHGIGRFGGDFVASSIRLRPHAYFAFDRVVTNSPGVGGEGNPLAKTRTYARFSSYRPGIGFEVLKEESHYSVTLGAGYEFPWIITKLNRQLGDASVEANDYRMTPSHEFGSARSGLLMYGSAGYTLAEGAYLLCRVDYASQFARRSTTTQFEYDEDEFHLVPYTRISSLAAKFIVSFTY